MSNVVDIDTMRPHRVGSIQCGHCNHPWVGVWPDIAKALECPQCKGWVNEFGTPVSYRVCETCKRPFTLCPAAEGVEGWENCLADECGSYDPNRDVDRFFDAVRREPIDPQEPAP